MNCHGMEEFDMNQKRIKKGYLTQDDIDHGHLPPVSRRAATWREALAYLNGYPGGILTTVVFLIIFAAVMWGLFAAWTVSNTLITAVKG